MVCYSGYNNDFEVLKKSSSGGIFYELAVKVIEAHGMVFGAGFNKDGTVSLKGVENLEELDNLLGSKYVQAHPENVYSQVKSKLKNKVLFCGTPCQCNALMQYLNGTHPENLLIVDFVCHGIPSERVWKEYLDYLNADMDSCSISFRDKRDGWKNYGISIKRKGEKEYFCHHGKDSFFRLFISDLILRPSCYFCKSKGERRSSDITIGDFWSKSDEITNSRGCSLIVTHSEIGEAAVEEISNKIALTRISSDKAFEANKSYYTACTLPYRRKRIFDMLEEDTKKIFEKAEKLAEIPLAERAMCKVQRKIENKLEMKDKHSYLEMKCPSTVNEKSVCCGCGACANACPTGAIKMTLDTEGFIYPSVDDSKCCSCGKCKKVCFSYQR